MGGYGSGRQGGRPTVERGLTLDITKLLRDGLIRPMTSRSNATLYWRYVGSGETVAQIGYSSHLEERSGHMRLKYGADQRVVWREGPSRDGRAALDDSVPVRGTTLVVRVPVHRPARFEAPPSERCDGVSITPGLPARVLLPASKPPRKSLEPGLQSPCAARI
jgi:hypothetical protein